MSAPTLTEAAQEYLSRGWSVVPAFGKRAFNWGEYQRRLPNPDELEMMFQSNGHGDPTGVAIVGGPATWEQYPYLAVLEFESRFRDEAEPWLDQHVPGWRSGLLAESGGGSLHVYIRAPRPVSLRHHGWGEIRGSGSITVLPPSIHPNGQPYKWLSESQPLDVETEGLPLPGLSHDTPLYKTLADSPITEGARNATLTSLGGLLRSIGLDVDTIEATLLAVNTERCSPPLGAAEVADLARSVGRYPIPDSRSLIETGIGNPTEGAWNPVKAWLEAEPTPRSWAIEGLIPAEAVSIIYGDAGVYKTYLAVALACSVASGLPFLGRDALRGPVFYLDAELDRDEFLRRAYRAARGLGLGGIPEGVHYFRLPASLGDSRTFDHLAGMVANIQPVLTVVDSLSIASFGTDLERPAEMTTVMQRLRSLGTVLALDHVPKPQPGVNMSHYRPFGSAFKFAMARSVIQMLSTESGRGVALRHSKANFGPKQQPISVGVAFASDTVAFTVAGIGADELEGIEDQLPALERVARALGGYPQGVTAEELAEELELNVKTVRNHLTTLRQQGRANPLGDSKWTLTPHS